MFPAFLCSFYDHKGTLGKGQSQTKVTIYWLPYPFFKQQPFQQPAQTRPRSMPGRIYIDGEVIPALDQVSLWWITKSISRARRPRPSIKIRTGLGDLSRY